jgi:hypothetical protein
MSLTLLIEQLTSSLSQFFVPCELHHVSSRLVCTPSLIIRHLSSKPYSKKIVLCENAFFFLIIAASNNYTYYGGEELVLYPFL